MVNENITSLLEQEAEAVRNIPVTPGYEEAVSLIVKHVHDLGGKLIMSGMGKAGQIALNIATTFSSTGTPAFFLHPSEAQHGDLGIVCKNDIMLLISNSGKTRELVELVEVCPLGLTPTTSTTVMTVIGDILVVGTMKRIHFTNKDYAKRHHGGYLGSKSRELSKNE